MSVDSSTEIPENDDACTPAMVTGALVMKLMTNIRDSALLEGEGE